MKFYPNIRRKVSIICSVIIFSINIVNAQMNAPLYAELSPKEVSKQSNYITQNGSLVYIDFVDAPFKIERVQVFTLNYELVSHEFVGDLPKNTFYEINLKSRRPGAYIIHLVGGKKSTKKAIRIR